jgi:hypothetical protein
VTRRSGRSFAQRQLRSRFLTFLRELWKQITVVALVFAVLAALTSIIQPTRFLAGFFVGVLVSAFIGVIGLLFLMMGGNALTLSGIWAEGFAHDEIKSATKKGHVWGGIDNIEIGGFDIDHLVFAPGGVFAIETKAHTGKATSMRLEADLQQARDAARKAASVLRSKHVEMPEDVTPVLVIWGRRFTEGLPEEGLVRDGVHVLALPNLASWLSTYRHGRIAQDNANEAMWRLLEFKSRQVARPPKA